MRQYPARALYEQIEDTLASITRQLRSAIRADSKTPSSGAASVPGDLLGRARWAHPVTAELASTLLDTLGLAATIEWHLRQFEKCTGIVHELNVSDAGGRDLPEAYADAIFDIYSEALSNVARHAGASEVAVLLVITAREVTLAVADNGIGLANAAPASAGGIASMRAQTLALAGSCAIEGPQYAGTTITVHLPRPL